MSPAGQPRRFSDRPLWPLLAVVSTEQYLLAMATIAHDLRQMMRALARRPGYAATVAITLGLGIGATTTIYSVIDTMLLRPLPYHASDQLMLIGNTVPDHEWFEGREGVQRLESISLHGFNALRARVHG